MVIITMNRTNLNRLLHSCYHRIGKVFYYFYKKKMKKIKALNERLLSTT